MSRWTCPECGGKFPHAIYNRNAERYACPWCSFKLAKWATEAIRSHNISEKLGKR